jgi:truncated hemoglobin YjbI
LEKQHKNTPEDNKVDNQKFILTIVTAFYEKAVSDFLIGYQFRKIATKKGAHPLRPPIEAFAEHIPRIAVFWEMQLLGEKLPKEQKPFDLISLHHELSIRKGELGRWLLLFKETLNQSEYKDHSLTKEWLAKLNHFESIFIKKLF